MEVKIAMAAIVAVAMLNAPAFAQGINTGSRADANSNSSASVNVGSQSGAFIYQEASVIPTRTTTELRNVPSVSAPGIITSNVCGLGVSGGISAVGGGISFGGTYIDDNCEAIQQAAALNTLLGADVAVLHLANSIPAVCVTLRQTGAIPADSVCSADEKRALARPARRVKTTVLPAAAPVLSGLSQCEKRDGKVYIGYTRGADKASAKATCLASLGY